MEVVPPLENFHAFVYTVLPFSMLPYRTDQNIVLSGKNVAGLIVFLVMCVLSCGDLIVLCAFADVVGLVNKVTDVFPPSGNARSQKQHVC
jgi:hypothetical protein